MPEKKKVFLYQQLCLLLHRQGQLHHPELLSVLCFSVSGLGVYFCHLIHAVNETSSSIPGKTSKSGVGC